MTAHLTTADSTATAGLVAATRQLMLAAATTDLPAGELDSASDAITAIADKLGSQVRPRVRRIDFDLPARVRAQGTQWETYQLNPFGIPLAVSFDGETASATLVADALLEGPPESLHGGWSAHLMDCMLGGLLQATGTRAVTATLDLRYVSRAPLDRPLELHAEIVSRAGRKIRATGWIEHDGARCVEAQGLFITVDATAPGSDPATDPGTGSVTGDNSASIAGASS